MSNTLLFQEMLRMFKRNIRVRIKGLRQYTGDDKQICQQIIKECYNSAQKYFMVSNGHFTQFYMRDFSLCTQALMQLGYKKEVHNTLQYALSAYTRHNKITTQITPHGKPIDSFAQSTDSLPFLLRSLRLAKAQDLIQVYKPFLEAQAIEYKNAVFDRKTNLVKHGYFSTIKDGFKRNSSCYDNACVAATSQELTRLRLKNPFTKLDLASNLKNHFWNGKYFYDDLDKQEYVAGDANTFPFYFGIIKDNSMKKKAIASIIREGLDHPLPLKYTKKRYPSKQIIAQRLTVPNYEGNTVWVHLGLAYMSIVEKTLLNKYLESYKNAIMRYHNFLEVYNPDRTPYKSIFYYCDESMSWAANYLHLKIPKAKTTSKST